MKATLYINPLDLQRAVAFTALEKAGRPNLCQVQIEYTRPVEDLENARMTNGKSMLRATDSFRMVEIETSISADNQEPPSAGMWYIERLDALAAMAKARIKKFPYAICEVNDEVANFPKGINALWEKPASSLEQISFNSKLLADSIKALRCQNVRLEFAGGNERVVLAPENSRVRALIMPIRTEI